MAGPRHSTPNQVFSGQSLAHLVHYCIPRVVLLRVSWGFGNKVLRHAWQHSTVAAADSWHGFPEAQAPYNPLTAYSAAMS